MPTDQSSKHLEFQALKHVLGDTAAQLVDIVAMQAQAQGLCLYLVGGVVRDLILGVSCSDLDFVLESDADAFARQLAAQFGGSALAHKAFGTATWTPGKPTAEILDLPAETLPAHIDFARARSESYARPAALPTVAPADIQADLSRRDFSINSIALKLSPADEAGKLLDNISGLRDLNQRKIRVLHERSFIDDPTRILRALRFAVRLQFAIEPRTAALLQSALPLLERVTGPRLANELDLILHEPEAGEMLLQLNDLGALASIHSSFRISPALPTLLARLNRNEAPWQIADGDRHLARWCLLLASPAESEAHTICQRLDLTQAQIRAITDCADLMSAAAPLCDRETRPSAAARLLDDRPEASLYAAWLLLADSPAARSRIAAYWTEWRHQKTATTGEDLKRLGLPPGPRFKQILAALHAARLDGEIATADEESAYLRTLLAEES